MSRLSPRMLQVLGHLATGRKADTGVSGMSAYGGLSGTLVALRRAGLIDTSDTITAAGRAALGHPWTPASTPPPMPHGTETWDHETYSDVVLVVIPAQGDHIERQQMLATYRADKDPDFGGPRWKSACSEGWEIHHVSHWRPLDWPLE